MKLKPTASAAHVEKLWAGDAWYFEEGKKETSGLICSSILILKFSFFCSNFDRRRAGIWIFFFISYIIEGAI